MANLNTAINIILTGGDTVGAGLRSVGGALGELDGMVTGLASPFADVAKYVEAMDAALLGLATVAIVKSIQSAKDFQGALGGLNKFLDDSEQITLKNAQAYEDLAQKYGVGVGKVVASTADFTAANYDLNTSLGLTKTAMDIAIAGEFDTATATDLLKKSLSGMNVAQSEAAATAIHLGDVLNYMGDKSAFGLKEIMQGFSILSPSIQSTKLSVEELSAILSVVVDNIGSGSQAADGLKTVFGNLAKPTKDQAELLKELGIQLNSNDVPLGNTKDILEKIAAAFSKAEPEQQKYIAATIAGTDQSQKFTALMNGWPTVLERVNGALQTTGGAVGSMDKEVARALENTTAKFNTLGESIDQLSIHVGYALLDSVSGAAGGLTELTNAFKSIVDSGALKPFTDLIEQNANRIAATLRAMAANLPQAFAVVDFSGLLSSIGSLGDELGALFKALFGDIDLTTVAGLASALQTAVNAGESLTLTTQGIIKAFEPFAAAIGKTVQHFNDLDAASKVDFGTFIGDMQAIVTAGGLVGAAIIALGQATIELSPIFDAVFGGIKVGVNALQVTFDAIVLGVLNLKKTLLEALLAANEFGQSIAFTDAAKAENARAIAGIKASLQELGVTMDAVSANLERNKTELEQGYAQATGAATEKTDQLKARLDAAKESLSVSHDEILRNNSAMQDWSTGLQQAKPKVEAVAKQLTDWSDGLVKANGHLKEIGVSQDALSKTPALDSSIQKTQVWDAALGKLVTVYTTTSDAAVKATGSFASVGNSAADQAKKVDEAAKASETFRAKMEEIASNERIKTIEARVQLNVAELEAQTKQVEAAFDSISKTVDSTGSLLGSLFGDYSKASGITQAAIASQIDLENQRRQKALDLQSKLTEAEIDKINAQTAALDRGDSLIRIDGSGLAPQLEAFMWEVLKAIKVRANAEFSSYLLGIAA